MKRILLFFLCILMVLLCYTTVANAEEASIEPRFTYIINHMVGLNINSSGKAICSSSVESKSGYPVLVQCKLQQKVGEDWTTVKYWTKSGTGAAIAGGIYYVHSGYEYRVVAIVQVYTTNNTYILESSTQYSDVIPH